MVNDRPFILVVEDDAPVRNLISTTLETQNYKYIVSENGTKADWLEDCKVLPITPAEPNVPPALVESW